MKNKNQIIDRTGEINYNKFGSKMEIIRYNKNNDIDIYFEEYDYIFYHAQYYNFKKGNIKCPYEPRTYGYGFLGEGKYKVRENNRKTEMYIVWNGILRRCYDDNFKVKNPTYIDCVTSNEWLNFQNFAEWYEENYYEVKGERIELDKDILYKGNKVYSRDTCVFVPERINNLFTKRNSKRGKYPIGVSYEKNSGKYISTCHNNIGERIYLGLYDTPEEAFQVYKQYKEKLIKQVADEYKPYIPKELYEAMYRYEVEITD